MTACVNARGVAWCRINPVDEEGKTRSPEKMSELVHESHQANTRKALQALKVPHPNQPAPSLLLIINLLLPWVPFGVGFMLGCM